MAKPKRQRAGVYQVGAITPSPAPDGAAGKWFRVVITGPAGAVCDWITRGPRADVQQRAERKAARLNAELGIQPKGMPPIRLHGSRPATTGGTPL